jgi:hypothetical protein
LSFGDLKPPPDFISGTVEYDETVRRRIGIFQVLCGHSDLASEGDILGAIQPELFALDWRRFSTLNNQLTVNIERHPRCSLIYRCPV